MASGEGLRLDVDVPVLVCGNATANLGTEVSSMPDTDTGEVAQHLETLVTNLPASCVTAGSPSAAKSAAGRGSVGDPAKPPPRAADPGAEGARVIALNMALNGSTRDETARYLSENFELEDPETLLDDVYARAGAD